MSILQNIEAGKVDLLDIGVYGYLVLKADSAGVVTTSATTLRALYPKVSSRTMQRKLRQLERVGLVKIPEMSSWSVGPPSIIVSVTRTR